MKLTPAMKAVLRKMREGAQACLVENGGIVLHRMVFAGYEKDKQVVAELIQAGLIKGFEVMHYTLTREGERAVKDE